MTAVAPCRMAETASATSSGSVITKIGRLRCNSRASCRNSSTRFFAQVVGDHQATGVLGTGLRQRGLRARSARSTLVNPRSARSTSRVRCEDCPATMMVRTRPYRCGAAIVVRAPSGAEHCIEKLDCKYVLLRVAQRHLSTFRAKRPSSCAPARPAIRLPSSA